MLLLQLLIMMLMVHEHQPLGCCCAPADSEFWKEEGTGVGGSEIDAYPYVSLTLNTDV